jgi:hypothetical protein
MAADFLTFPKKDQALWDHLIGRLNLACSSRVAEATCESLLQMSLTAEGCQFIIDTLLTRLVNDHDITETDKVKSTSIGYLGKFVAKRDGVTKSHPAETSSPLTATERGILLDTLNTKLAGSCDPEHTRAIVDAIIRLTSQ